MVRGKTELKRIENSSSRQVTFSKRRSGLMKKAQELSVLCDAEVGLIVFSHSGKLYEFANTSIKKTIERYQRHTKDVESSNKVPDNAQKLKEEAAGMTKRIEILEASKRRLLGEDLDVCSTDDLHQMERELERSLGMIRARKNELLLEKIEQLKEKEKILSEENAMLYGKSGLQPLPLLLPPPPPPPPVSTEQDLQNAQHSQNSQNSEVENAATPQSIDSPVSNIETELCTELCIGWPYRERHLSRKSL